MTSPAEPLNTGGMIDATALIPVNTLVHVVAGPHKNKTGRVRSASGDGHVMVAAVGEKRPVRVNVKHVARADSPSPAADASIRAMANKTRGGAS